MTDFKTRIDKLKTAAESKDEDDSYTQMMKAQSLAYQSNARQFNRTYGALIIS